MMKSLAACHIILLAICCTPLAGQQPDTHFSAALNDVPFDRFVEIVEQETPARFYFREQWMRGIRVTLSGDEISLRQSLDRILDHTGLGYHMNSDLQVFIVNRTGIVTMLPDYSTPGNEMAGIPETPGPDKLTPAEAKYVEGRRIGMLETIVVGNSRERDGVAEAVINGRVTDGETGEPLIGATIYIQELKKGVATDGNGRFTLVIDPGTYTAEFACMGMETGNYTLSVLSGGALSVTMQKALIPITEVVISANRYHNVRGTQMGFDRLNYKLLKEVPIVMGEKDIMKVIQMLPGVQSVGEGAAGFNVRGSAVDQNMIYIQKVPVYNSSHLLGFFTSFSPDIVKDFTLYKSNLPASFGGRLASFFDITTRQGNMNYYTARGGISPVTAHLSAEGPIQRGTSSFILSGRSTYSDWILGQIEDPVIRTSQAGFFDLSGGLAWEPGEKTVLKAFGYYSRDRFRLGNVNDYEYANTGASVTLRHMFTSRIAGELALVYGSYDFANTEQTNPAESYSHQYRIDHYELKADMSWISLGKHKVTYGAAALFYDLNRGKVIPYGEYSLRRPLDLGIENGVEASLYVADEVMLLPQLTLYGGLRFTTFLVLGTGEILQYRPGEPLRPEHVTDTLQVRKGEVTRTYTSLEPRFAVNYLIGTNRSLKFSYNRVKQFLFMLSNTVAVSPTDQWKLCDYQISPPYVDQLSIGYYEDRPGAGLSTSLELYYKWVKDVIEYRDGANFVSTPHVEQVTLPGKQEAYGVEAMVRKSGGQLSGWLSYSYARSIMQVASPVPGDQINGGDPYPSNYDRPHSLNLVTNFKVNRRLSLSANVVYSTGRPVTYPVSIYYLDGIQFVDFSARNSYRIPDYFRVDFSINLEGNLRERKLSHSYWMLNFYNLTGRENAYSVYFQNENGVIHGYKLSIFARPVITLSWNFKLGNYASE